MHQEKIYENESNLTQLVTESRNEKSTNIDSMDTIDILKIINEEDRSVPDSIQRVLPEISKATEIVRDTLSANGRLFYIGAGTSGRIGVLDAVECNPTYGVSHDQIQGIIAGGYDAMFKALEGAEDDSELGKEDIIKAGVSKGDTVIGLTASGRTPYVLGALEKANQLEARTVGICCNPNSELGKVAEICIEAVVGPEVITGSTRMKAGTAQKLICNMITSTAMVQLGKVYQNLMVSLQDTNFKLKERLKSIVMKATDVDYEQAEKILVKANNDVKLAIIMQETGVTLEKAEEVLTKHQGHVKKSIEFIR